jgi:hypothetical protein
MAKVETNEVRKLTDTETMLGILQSGIDVVEVEYLGCRMVFAALLKP